MNLENMKGRKQRNRFKNKVKYLAYDNVCVKVITGYSRAVLPRI